MEINAEIRSHTIPVHFYIRTPRIVERLAWIDLATLEEVQRKLLNRELTVNDVEESGNTLLHVRVSSIASYCILKCKDSDACW